MFHSIFRKQFFVSITILLLAFAISFFSLKSFIRAFVTGEKEKSLEKRAETIAREYELAFSTSFLDLSKLNNLQKEIQITKEHYQAQVLIVNEWSEILFASEDIDKEWIGKIIDLNILEDVFVGKLVTVEGKLNHIYSENMLSVLYPMEYQNRKGAVILSSSLPQLEGTVAKMSIIIIQSFLISIIFSFLLIFFFSRKLTRPLVRMSLAAKKMSSGNFEEFIHIKTNDEIQNLGDALNEMAKRLKLQEEEKKQMMTNISHDLRTPLTNIEGYIHAILDHTIDQNIDEYLTIVLSETKRLKEMSNQILELEHLELGQNEMYSVIDMHQFIKSILQQFSYVIKEKKLLVNVIFENSQLYIYSNKKLMQQVLYNLFDNAFKFTDVRKKVTIRCIKKDHRMFFQIENDAYLPKEECRKIFERFYKLDDSRSEFKVGGLGLSIVKKYLQELGSDINCETNEKDKISFSFSTEIYENN